MPERRAPFSLFDTRPLQRFFTGTHEFWYRLTGGFIGGNFFGTPVLLLTTTGRRTGKTHTTPLTYLADADDYVVIASNGGNDRHPQWWLNLLANPSAEVQVMSTTSRVIASEVEGDERDRLWTRIVTRFPVYGGYERRTSRRIPVVLLRREA